MKRILLADDNEVNRELVREYLLTADYLIEEARDGKEAVDKALASPPDLLLLDLQMPFLDGYGVLQRLRQDPRMREVPVVAFTGFAMNTDRDKVAAAGFDGYLSKPIELKSLLQEIERHLAR